MDGLDDAIAAVDSGWGVVALLIIGFYALAWKYGGEGMRLLRDSNNVAHKSAMTANNISENIVTNHGSKNLGDAIDRLTTWFLEDRRDREIDAIRIQKIEENSSRALMEGRDLALRLSMYVDTNAELNAFGRKLMADVQAREAEYEHEGVDQL